VRNFKIFIVSAVVNNVCTVQTASASGDFAHGPTPLGNIRSPDTLSYNSPPQIEISGVPTGYIWSTALRHMICCILCGMPYSVSAVVL